MKVAYIDFAGGISGDMLLSAFLDAGFKIGVLRGELSKLNLSGYKILTRRVNRHHIDATKLDITINRECKFKAEDFEKIIKKSRLQDEIKQMALKVFDALLSAERKIHRNEKPLDLHELGSMDTILDIVGTCICMIKWNIQRLYFSKPNFGTGLVKTESGILPIPAPASLELLKNIPSKFTSVHSELVTPTGASVLSALGAQAADIEIKIDRIGYGAGSRDLKQMPNILRILIGEEVPSYLKDTVTVIESSIDDTVPVVFSYLQNELLKRGALDVYVTNVQMKKNRPGQLLTVLVPNHLLGEIADIIFRETDTIGLRYYRAQRLKLHRKTVRVPTRFGKVSVKLSGTDKEIYKASPEYEACKKIAVDKKISFTKVYNEAKKAISLLVLLVFTGSGASFSDRVYLKDGSDVKGIVVEEYRDRIVISTEYGEAMMKKSEIKNIDYDLPEQNLVQFGNRYRDTGDFNRAYFYYGKARIINPQFKAAIDGANYVEGFLFRRELALKDAEVKWRQHVEDFQYRKSIEEEVIMSNLKQAVGLEIEDTGRDIIVTKVYKELAAEQAGLEEGDSISSIWGRLAGYLSKHEVAELLTKKENLELKLQIDRNIKAGPNLIKSSQLDLRFEGLNLVNIDSESMAYDRGLRNDDLILAIDGKSIRYTPLEEVLHILKTGPRTLLVRREMTIWRRR